MPSCLHAFMPQRPCNSRVPRPACSPKKRRHREASSPRMPAGSSGSLGYVDVLAVDHFEDGTGAGSVAVLVHGDFSGDPGEVLESGKAAADPVAIGIQIVRIVGDTRRLDAVLVGIDDVVGPRAAVGRPLAAVPVDA